MLGKRSTTQSKPAHPCYAWFQKCTVRMKSPTKPRRKSKENQVYPNHTQREIQSPTTGKFRDIRGNSGKFGLFRTLRTLVNMGKRPTAQGNSVQPVTLVILLEGMGEDPGPHRDGTTSPTGASRILLARRGALEFYLRLLGFMQK